MQRSAYTAGISWGCGGGCRPRLSCAVTLLFFEPWTDAGRLIDEATGGLGYSHVAVDACEQHDGEPMIFDCQVGEGVTRSPRARYHGRGVRTVTLASSEGAELRACLAAKVGKPYELGGLFGLGGEEAITCANAVASCLPQRLRELVRGTPARGWSAAMNPDLMSANRIAEAFGVALHLGGR